MRLGDTKEGQLVSKLHGITIMMMIIIEIIIKIIINIIIKIIIKIIIVIVGIIIFFCRLASTVLLRAVSKSTITRYLNLVDGRSCIAMAI